MRARRFMRFPPFDPSTPAPPCADCGAALTLRRAEGFWRCTTSKCRGKIRAHANGAPMGTPGDRATRAARWRAHEALDSLWKSGEMSRDAAYGFLRTVLFLPREKAHIGMLTREQCEKLVELVAERGRASQAAE